MPVRRTRVPGVAFIRSKYMKQTIKFGQRTAILERSKTVAILEITPNLPAIPLPMSLAELADAISETENVDVHTILPGRSKIAFTVGKGISNTKLIDTIRDAISVVFDTDTVVCNE